LSTCRCQAEEDHSSSGTRSKKAKAASRTEKQVNSAVPSEKEKQVNSAVPCEKENLSPANLSSALRIPTAFLSRPSDVDFWGGHGISRTQQVLHMFDKQREKFENDITDQQRKTEADLSKSRRDAGFYQDKLTLWSVLQ